MHWYYSINCFVGSTGIFLNSNTRTHYRYVPNRKFGIRFTVGLLRKVLDIEVNTQQMTWLPNPSLIERTVCINASCRKTERVGAALRCLARGAVLSSAVLLQYRTLLLVVENRNSAGGLADARPRRWSYKNEWPAHTSRPSSRQLISGEDDAFLV